jgi:hypothetical protein
MTREAVETALRAGPPFTIFTVEGQQFSILEEHRVALAGMRAVVLDERDCPRLLDLDRVASIQRLPSDDGSATPWL